MKATKRLDNIARVLGMKRQDMLDIFHSMRSGQRVIVGENTILRIDEGNRKILRVLYGEVIVSSVVIR
jgi:hypothetical protein